MRNLLALVGAQVIGFGGIGWYMGWYTLHVDRAPDGTIEIKTDVDAKKVTEDTSNGAKQVSAFIGHQAEKAQQGAEANPPANTPGPLTTPKTDPGKSGGWFDSIIHSVPAAPK